MGEGVIQIKIDMKIIQVLESNCSWRFEMRKT
jgi:hypothetical protein